MENNQRCTIKKVRSLMPKGKGTYSKVGRPKKRKKMTKSKRRK